MFHEVSNVSVHQRSIPLQHQQVLSVLLFGSSGEVERPRDQGLPVDDQDFVVCDGMLVVNVGRNTGMSDEVG